MTTWCRFEKDGQTSYGLIEGDRVIGVDGSPFGTYQRNARSYPLASVKLLIPVVPPTFYCVGINYADHIRKMAAKRGTEPSFPKRPDIGYRANNALIAHEENIVKPARRRRGSSSTRASWWRCSASAAATSAASTRSITCWAGPSATTSASAAGRQDDRTLWRAKNCRHLQADGAVDRHRRSTSPRWRPIDPRSTARKPTVSPPTT